MSTPGEHETVSNILNDLSQRLQRLEFFLGPEPASSAPSIRERLRGLEDQLAGLARDSPAIDNLLSLHTRHQHLFAQHPPEVDTTARKTQVLASASLYAATSSQLLTLRDTKIPQAQMSLDLIKQRQRLDHVNMRGRQQAAEVAELRGKSARLVQEWMENGVVGMGGLVAAWETRLMEAEKGVRRRERQAEED